MKAKQTRERLYLGVDIGGTKIQASLVAESGTILGRQRQSTPRPASGSPCGPEQILAGVEAVMKSVLAEANLETTDLTGIGVAVPGVVDPKSGNVIVTPNMGLTGVAIGAHLESCFRVPVVIGNDGNLGTYGEAWLGSARKARSALGIWVGTGIGAGFVQKGKVWRGAREAAGEIGHIVMQIGGPVCGCGNHGCLEALASRTAIERDIREALAAGGTSKLSGGLRRRPERHSQRRHPQGAEGRGPAGDRHPPPRGRNAGLRLPHRAASDRPRGHRARRRPDRGLQRIHDADRGEHRRLRPAARRRDGGHVLLSALGDNAVVLGAVALARRLVGRSPFKKIIASGRPIRRSRGSASARSWWARRPITTTFISRSPAR